MTVPEVYYKLDVPSDALLARKAIIEHLGIIFGVRFREIEHQKEADLFHGPVPVSGPKIYIPYEDRPTFLTRFSCFQKNGGIAFEADMLGFIGQCLFRHEEDNAPRDQWGCFRAQDSFLMPKISEPSADKAVEALCDAFSMLGLKIANKIWPNNAKFAVALSHDVDLLPKTVSHHSGNSHWNFGSYRALEGAMGYRSAFYLTPIHRGDRINPKYNLNEPGLLFILRELFIDGWEIGCHLSYGSHLNPFRIREEKNTLERAIGSEISGGRCHFLPFETKHTPFLQASSGYQYDTTLGYNETIGFRSGTSFPHRFLGKDGRTGGVLELPLHIMDGALFWDMGLTDEEALEEMKKMAAHVKNVGGCLNILWHLRVLDNPDYPGWGDVYKSFLMWLKDKDAWVTTPANVALWWIEREQRCAA
ncbi:polysaccharide deacetylase family protein [Thermodesulfobacteriota bacterium]